MMISDYICAIGEKKAFHCFEDNSYDRYFLYMALSIAYIS